MVRVKQFNIVIDKPIKGDKLKNKRSGPKKKKKTKKKKKKEKENEDDVLENVTEKIAASPEQKVEKKVEKKVSETSSTKKKKKKKGSIAGFFTKKSEGKSSIASFFSKPKSKKAEKMDVDEAEPEKVEKMESVSGEKKRKRKIVDSSDEEDEDDVVEQKETEKKSPAKKQKVENNVVEQKSVETEKKSPAKKQKVENNSEDTTAMDVVTETEEDKKEVSASPQKLEVEKESEDTMDVSTEVTETEKSIEDKVSNVLAIKGLELFASAFVGPKIGVESLEDLEEVDEDMMKEIGMSPIQRKKFKKILQSGKHKDVQSDASVTETEKVEKDTKQEKKKKSKMEKMIEEVKKLEDGNTKLEKILQRKGAKSVDDFLVCVISKGRSENVPSIHALFQGNCKKYLPTWIVGKGEAEAYKSCGAINVVEGGSLCGSRNMAIQLAKSQNKICVEISDDISRCVVIHSDEPWTKPASLPECNALAKSFEWLRVSPPNAARYVELQMRECGAKLDLFVVGDFLVIDPKSKPRFDEGMTLKEDYDFTSQHLKKYGVVARSNRLIVIAKHYTNAGGAVEARNDEREQYNIAVLRHKWPGVFPQHATRGVNEVRMSWKTRDIGLGGKRAITRPPAPKGYVASKIGVPPVEKKKSIVSFFGKK